MRSSASPVSMRAQREPSKVCAVCRGTGSITRRCHRCAGRGHMLTRSPWLQTPVVCPDCRSRGQKITRCGACNGIGGD
jgi:DnaJ-class molecular chaperone